MLGAALFLGIIVITVLELLSMLNELDEKE